MDIPRLVPSIMLVAGMLAAPAQARPDRTPARALAGRVAGVPVNCLGALERDRGGGIYDSGDILYRGRGGRIYINHPRDCPMLKSDRAIVTVSPTGEQCRGDIFEVRDRTTPIGYGSCTLDSFIPYDRPKPQR